MISGVENPEENITQNGDNNLDVPMVSIAENSSNLVRPVKTEPSESEVLNYEQFESIEDDTRFEASNHYNMEDTAQNGENDSMDDSLASMNENPPTLDQSVKSEQSESIEDTTEMVEDTSTGRFVDADKRGELESSGLANSIECSLQYLTNGFQTFKQKYEKMEDHLKLIEETNTKLINENEQLKVEMENRIETLKETHNQEMAKLKEEHQRLIGQQKLAMEQFKRDCLRRVEEAKNLLQFD